MGVRRASAGAVVAVLAACASASAQIPAVPGAPALPGGPVPAALGPAATAAPAAAPAAPRNIWSFFMKTPEQKAQCKAHFCNSRIGMFFNNLLVPAGAATGGFLGPICPPPGIGPGGPANPADLALPPTSPLGAAARIKAEEAQAKAKVAAIEYLATVDCRYYPEAEAGLIAGLRAEKNECVRIAAAKAFANGCCCSSKVIKALLITVNCSTRDGFPAEASEVVRTYAYVALERCLLKCMEEEPEPPPEPPPAAKKAMYETLAPMSSTVDFSSHILLANYYPLEAKESRAQVIAEAQRTLARGLKISSQTAARISGPKNLADAVFPRDARPAVSLASFFKLPSLPSFAAIRRSRSREQVPGQTQPRLDGPPEAPIAVEGREPEAIPPGGSAEACAPTSNTPPAPTQTATRSGRGNLLHIFQDAWRR